MKIFKKVLTAIGHFFRNIWRYIMTNAWIQPILIVALIFAIIFGLTGVPKLFDKIEGWFDDSTDNKIKNQKKIDVDEFFELYEGNESFVIVFGEDDCANCKSLYKTINKYMDDEDHKALVGKDVEIYFMNITDLLEDVEKDFEDHGDDFINEKRKSGLFGKELEKSNFEYLEELGNILYNGYREILSSYNNNDEYSQDTEYSTSGYSYYPIQTPTTAFFTKDITEGAENSRMFNMVVGQWDWSKNQTTAGYFGINKAFEAWNASKAAETEEAYNAAVTTRNNLNQYHNG